MTTTSRSSSPTREAITAALSRVNDPELHRDVISLGMIRDLEIAGSDVSLRLVLTTPACPVRADFQEAVENAVRSVPGVGSVRVVLGAEVKGSAPAQGKKQVEGVRNIIAVASNKGGVGKSTVAVNLAVALAQSGARVGLVDADITGPNIPTMMGFEAGFMSKQPGLRVADAHGVRVASLGFLLPKGTPVVWRGPMIGTGVRQLLHDLQWGELDYLFVDLPPGTSDAPMSLAQDTPLAGAVIVSTPQEVALEDAVKAVAMFEKLNVPVFGIVENMSYFICPNCEYRHEIFGHGGARDAAEETGLDFLGEVPLDTRVRSGGDSGMPVTVADPDSPAAKAFTAIAERVAAKLSVLQRAGEM
ncbi:MAG: Mrp/NBP35 family ATP-binding protein [Chloroflexi bacterium]|nr:Mrp/NBP35 family ATP-binding protein [Chloroflexota bacterium]